MIEFSGHLTGSAEKRYFQKSIQPIRYLCLASLLIGLLEYRVLLGVIRLWPPAKVLIFIFYGLCLLSPLWLRIPRSEKRKLTQLPHNISIEDDFIVCVADAYIEGRDLSDVKLVRDFGEFYELVFPFGKYSAKFICQKALLTQGTLEEFEQLFEGKVTPARGGKKNSQI